MIYLKLDNISICETRAELGDAAFTFYRGGFKTAPEGAKNRAPLYHSHFYYECHILDGGESSFLIQGQAVSAEADTMVIIPPYTGHYPFQSDGTTGDRVICMLLEQTEPATGEFSYFQRTVSDMCNLPISVSEPMKAALGRLYDSLGEVGLRSECLGKAAAYEVLLHLFDEINGFELSGPRAENRGRDNRSIALEVMVADVRYSLGDIASALGYSKRHTTRLILDRYGGSLLQVRQQNMVSTAKKLLLSTPSLTVEAVAMAAGFSCAAAMTAAFKKWENMTPTEYKQRGGDDK